MDYNSVEAEEIIEELLLDNSMEERRLQLFNQIYGEGSSSSQRRMINRDREAGHDRLVGDYFSENPTYLLETFRRRVDALGRKGLSPLQKYTAAMRMLAYGTSVDVVDDYVRIGESTAIECLKKFVTKVILIFEDEYLRKPNENDVQRLLKMGEDRGFPGMMGSIDCMHWQ
ncbi:uncharacterized protein LOC141718685 [Apium graveolens]|uniref:uncharacterized protein LOC141718685 n=1 Tax=Apium graveolens TaxID=4045 RepID=UPI003D7A3A50